MTHDKTNYESQLEAMRNVMKALKPLSKDAQGAVLDWVNNQLGRSHGGRKFNDDGDATRNEAGSVAKRPGTVNSVAQKISANSCRTILAAAAAHLSIYEGRESFSREELISRAKEARGWKAVYTNQMATAINRMLDSAELFEKSKDVFSLSDAFMKTLEEKLA
jgi:hypothetical protein